MRGTLAVGLALGLLGCSTAEQPTPAYEQCRVDTDCDEGEVCAPTGFCSSEFAPRAYIAFDIQESPGQFRAEMFGCDEEFRGEGSGEANTLEVQRQVVSQTLFLSVVSVDASGPEDTDPIPLAATFEVAQASRLARPDVRRVASHPQMEGEFPGTETLTSIAWPRYRPEDRFVDGSFLVWTITPRAPEGELDRAPMLVMLNPPEVDETTTCEVDDDCDAGHACVRWSGGGACRPAQNQQVTYRDVRYQEVCERLLRGQVVWITPDLERGDVVVGANIGVRHGSDPEGGRFGIPASANVALDDRPPECTTDADCVENAQYCDTASRQCFLNLAGRVANATAIEGLTTGDDGRFSTNVYTYCEGRTSSPVRRKYLVNVSDRDADLMSTRVLPSINYDPDVVFSPPPNPGAEAPGEIDGALCVPDWGPPQSLQVELTGEPVTLLSSAASQDSYTCCDISCLPATPEAAELTTPVSEVACSGRSTTLRFEAPVASLTPQAVVDWQSAGCILPLPIADDGSIGVLSRNVRCSEETGQCEVTGLAAGPDGGPRTYRLRIESPEGSLFRSVDVPVDVRADPEPLSIALERRVLVRGRVVLAANVCASAPVPDEDCGSEGAFVMAERLRMPDEDARPPGPHFHPQIPTYFDPVARTRGHYVLPLDPGVWIVTALPGTGTFGGPAAYAVLDLRDEADRTHDFVLEEGSLVSLKLGAFDRRATVSPLDGGSWRDAPLTRPGDPERFIDLSAVDECWGDEGQGCRIRRLFPLGPLPASQAGQVRFGARLAPGVSINASADCTWP